MSSGRGGYKGQNYDPNYRRKRDHQSFDSRSKYSQTPTIPPRSNDDRSYDQPGYPGSQPLNFQSPRYDPYEEYARRHTPHVNSTPPPTTLPVSVPTGPASARSAPLPFTRSYNDTPSSVSAVHSLMQNRGPNGTSSTSSRTEHADRIKEDGEITSTFSKQSSPIATRVHPSRLGLVPQGTLKTPELANGNSTPSPSVSRSEAMTSGGFSQRPPDALHRTLRPTALSFFPSDDRSVKPANPGNGPVSSAPTPMSSQNQYQAAPIQSPLDSLEKLRKFKEQVAASRKPSDASNGPAWSQIASMAAKFLKSQDTKISENTFEQFKQMTDASSPVGETEAESALESSDEGPARQKARKGQINPNAGGTTPLEAGTTPDGPLSRQLELKQRLLALKSATGSQAGSSTPVAQPIESDPRPASPVQRQLNGPISGPVPGSKRPLSDPGEKGHAEVAEQKRFRAAAWQRANEKERQEQQERAETAVAAAALSKTNQARPSTSGDVRRDGVESSNDGSRGGSPPRGPRGETANADGDGRYRPGSLQARLGYKHPTRHGYGNQPQGRSETQVQREPGLPANRQHETSMSRQSDYDRRFVWLVV